MKERKPAEWMCNLDDLILSHLDSQGWATAQHIEREVAMNASEGRAGERLRMLAYAGLVAPIVEDSDMYELTSEGVMYLEGELDAENLKRPNPHIF